MNNAKIIEYFDVPDAPIDLQNFSSEEKAVLKNVNQRVAGAESLDLIMNFVFDSTADIHPCDRLAVAFGEDGNRRITSYWAKARYESLLLSKGYSEALQGSSLEKILSQRKVRIINDLPEYLAQHSQSRSTQLLVDEGVRSSMTCPLIVDGRPVGVMFRSSKQSFAYSPHQVNLHLAIAERLSQAVEKAYRIEQLEAANSAYMETLGFVSHELKSPLASMVSDAKLLTEGYVGELKQEQKEKIDRIIERARELLGMIGDYLNLSRIESGGLNLQIMKGLDLALTVIRPAIDTIHPLIRQKAMVLHEDIEQEPFPVDCDPELIRIVAVNLLSNAVKYGYEGKDIHLSLKREKNSFALTVRNEGPGFSEKESEQLFRKFSRLNTPELLKEKGTGVGLYTTWRIVNLHGGRIRAASEKGKWAEFEVEIPQPL